MNTTIIPPNLFFTPESIFLWNHSKHHRLTKRHRLISDFVLHLIWPGTQVYRLRQHPGGSVSYSSLLSLPTMACQTLFAATQVSITSVSCQLFCSHVDIPPTLLSVPGSDKNHWIGCHPLSRGVFQSNLIHYLGLYLAVRFLYPYSAGKPLLSFHWTQEFS